MLIPAPPEDLCLAYANTLFWRGSERPTEKLHGIDDLCAWIESAEGVPAGAVQPIRTWAHENPRKAAGLFAGAIALREALFRAFSAVAGGRPVRDAEFGVLRAALAEAPPRRELAREHGRSGWRVPAPRPLIGELLAPVLWSAGDLLLAGARRRVRQCANDKCLWLFVDESKSGTRRWCDMTSCGNRAKAQRHYARVKQS